MIIQVLGFIALIGMSLSGWWALNMPYVFAASAVFLLPVAISSIIDLTKGR